MSVRHPVLQHLLFLLALWLLSLAAVSRPDVARALMLAHVGVVLWWQPLLPARQRLRPAHAALVFGCAVVVGLFFNPWALTAWVLALIALAGTCLSALMGSRLRLFYAMACLWLALLLWLVVVPQASGAPLPALPWKPLGLGVGLVFSIGMAGLVRRVSARTDPGPRDYLNGTALALIVAVVWLGALVMRDQAGLAYMQGLLGAVGATGALLLAIAWLQAPQFGWSGPVFLWSQYFNTWGRPLEGWLQSAIEQYDEVGEARALVKAVSAGLLKLDGVAGVRIALRLDAKETMFQGRETVVQEIVDGSSLSIQYHLERPATPSLRWSLTLAARVLDALYGAKQRQQSAQAAGYMEAIHLTGARLTHDMKNLLQSLDSLIAAASVADDRPEALAALVQRQLPGIADRLREILARLKAPQVQEGQEEADAARWWAGLQARFADQACVRFEGTPAGSVPEGLFSHVADNLVHNAVRKCRHGQAQTVSVQWLPGPALCVADDGEPVAPAALEKMFEAPVRSESGFGVGLYQAARMAAQHQYRLRLEQNQKGAVRFVLEPTLSR